MERQEDPEVPRIGRGRLRPSFPLNQIIKILMMIVALVAVVMMRNSCAQGVSGWFNTVAPPPSPRTPDAGR